MNLKQSIAGPRNNAALPKLEVPTVGDDGVLPHDQWSQDLKILVPNTEFVKDSVIRLTVNGIAHGAARTVLESEASQPDFRFEFEIAHKDFPGGNPLFELRLNYTVQHPDTGDVSVAPYVFILVFDKEPPGSNPLAYLAFTQEQLEGVYPEDVAIGYLRATLPPWPKMAVGDKLTPWLGSAAPDGSNTTPGLISETQIVIAQGEVGRQVNVLFPADRIKALGDIPQHFGYQLQDKLGNTSSVSPTREIPVHLNNAKAKRLRSASKTRPALKVTRHQNPVYEALTIEGLRPSDGRLPASMLTTAIPVVIPRPAAARPNDVVQLAKNGSEPTDLFGAEFPMPAAGDINVVIAVADIPAFTDDDHPAITWQLDYRVYDPLLQNGDFAYKPVQIIFDKFAPAGLPPTPGALSFTPEQLSGITEDDMDATEGGLIVHIASWFDDDVDDQVQLWLGTGPGVGDGSYLALTDAPVPPVTNPAVGLNVVFPRAELEKLPPGLVYFGYRVTDWAGNASNLSATTPIDVYLTGVPTDLLAPLIPEAEPYNPDDGNGPAGTGLLTWDEASASTTVQIPTYTSVAPGDRVYIKWNAETSIPPVTVTQEDIDEASANDYLLETELPFQYVVSGGEGENIKVWYQVHAATGAPPVEAPAQYINVNLETAGGGGDLPDTPEHDNMLPLQVLSTYTGSVPNIIPPEAFASSANLTISRIGANSSPIWKLGDIISIHWGPDHTDDPADVVIDANNNNLNPLPIVITPEVIEDNGTGSIPVYYLITRPLGNGNESTARSVDTIVQVVAPGELPGGGTLGVAEFPDSVDPVASYPYRIVRRPTGESRIDTTLRVPLAGVSNVAVGDFITVDFYGVDDPTDANIDPNNPIIDESRIQVTDYVIVQADLTRGYVEVDLPYEKTYHICRNLSVTNYSIKNAAGSVQAMPTYILFALNYAGNVCALP